MTPQEAQARQLDRLIREEGSMTTTREALEAVRRFIFRASNTSPDAHWSCRLCTRAGRTIDVITHCSDCPAPLVETALASPSSPAGGMEEKRAALWEAIEEYASERQAGIDGSKVDGGFHGAGAAMQMLDEQSARAAVEQAMDALASSPGVEGENERLRAQVGRLAQAAIDHVKACSLCEDGVTEHDAPPDDNGESWCDRIREEPCENCGPWRALLAKEEL